jgi:hypothetical protein
MPSRIPGFVHPSNAHKTDGSWGIIVTLTTLVKGCTSLHKETVTKACIPLPVKLFFVSAFTVAS